MSTQIFGLLHNVYPGLLHVHKNIASADLTLFFVVQLVAKDYETVLELWFPTPQVPITRTWIRRPIDYQHFIDKSTPPK